MSIERHAELNHSKESDESFCFSLLLLHCSLCLRGGNKIKCFVREEEGGETNITTDLLSDLRIIRTNALDFLLFSFICLVTEKSK